MTSLSCRKKMPKFNPGDLVVLAGTRQYRTVSSREWNAASGFHYQLRGNRQGLTYPEAALGEVNRVKVATTT